LHLSARRLARTFVTANALQTVRPQRLTLGEKWK
jgi:hypothetical protein